MKKIGVLLSLIFILFMTTSAVAQNETNIEKAQSCLTLKAKGNCASLSIPEMAFTILSTDNSDILNECKTELIAKKCEEGLCSIKDAALAILSLDYAGEDTANIENWLLSQNRTPTELIWYLQEDSEGDTQCSITYAGNSYTINIGANKKIDSEAGDCLRLAQSDFWLQVADNCLDEKFTVSCNQNFITTFLYKHKDSAAINVLAETQEQSSGGVIDMQITARCFGDDKCDYEASAWAALALLETRHRIDLYLPYLIALADNNKNFMPDAFIYSINPNLDEYANKLVQERKLAGFWEVSGDKYYDTALALYALRDSSREIKEKSENWAYSAQDENGCWKDSILDTSILLWSLTDKAPPTIIPTAEDCEASNFFCVYRTDCSVTDELDNYDCSGQGFGYVCCKVPSVKTCDEEGGTVCSSDETCRGNEITTSDASNCCLSVCEKTPVAPVETECEQQGYNCYTSCTDSEEEVDFNCESGKVCCKLKEVTTKEEGGIPLWVWILLGILILGSIVIFLLRDRIKVYVFKFRSRFRKEAGAAKPTGPGPPPGVLPSKPGFPPIRRPLQVRRPIRRPPIGGKKMEETFEKLRKMSR